MPPPKRSAEPLPYIDPCQAPARVRSPGWPHSGFPRCRRFALAGYLEDNLQVYGSY